MIASFFGSSRQLAPRPRCHCFAYVDKAAHHYKTLIRVARAAMDYTHIPTLLYGVGAVAIMVILRKVNPRIPNVLIAVAITATVSHFTGLKNDAQVDVSFVK